MRIPSTARAQNAERSRFLGRLSRATALLLVLLTATATWRVAASHETRPAAAKAAAPKAQDEGVSKEEPEQEEDQTDGSDDENLDEVQALEQSARKYSVDTVSAQALTQMMALTQPTLPDLSPYTPAAAEQRIVRKPGGRVSVGSLLTEISFKSFRGGDEQMREWARRQLSLPKAIFIHDGYVTPHDLARMLPKQYFEETEKGVFVARLPIDIRQGATLHIGHDVKDFRLSFERGAFLVNEGKLFVTGSRIQGWNEAKKAPTWFRDKHEFRPFLVSWGGSETYLIESVVAHLGYAETKSYGVSISQFSPKVDPITRRARPTGWLLNSEFFDNWYGFYCYEADDVVIRGNNYHDNIKYGIDPHDRSRRLIIAENSASGTKEKHGIIVSREVNDSWIINNKSFENTLSGIVVDRSSANNVVALNQIFRNHSDGITIYESPQTVIWQNLIAANQRHGIRVRNSLDVQLRENVAIGNGLSGVYGHIKNLADTGRNLQLDPFRQTISMLVVGGQLVSNGSGPVTIDQPLSLELYDVDLREPRRQLGIKFSGILGEYQQQVLDILVRQNKPVVIRPAADPRASG